MADQDTLDALAFQSSLLSETILMVAYCVTALKGAQALPKDEAELIAGCMKRIAEKIDTQLDAFDQLPGDLAPLLSSLARHLPGE